MMHPKLTLICRILKKPVTSQLMNGEFRTAIDVQANGGIHPLEVISCEPWADEIEFNRFFKLEMDVVMNNEHIILFQKPVWKYL